MREIYRRDDVDIASIYRDPVTHEVLSVTFEVGSETRHHFLDQPRALYQPRLQAIEHAIDDVRVEGSSADLQQIVYFASSPIEPGAHYLHNVSTGKSFLVGQQGAKLDRSRLQRIETFKVESTDQISVEALLTLPDESHPLPVRSS